MPKNEKRRQKSLQRHAAKRKQKKQAIVRQATPASYRAVLRSAAHWPLEECLITEDWDQEGELVQILVARSSPDGLIAAAGILVDLACLGVKDALSDIFTAAEYEQFRSTFTSLRPMKKANLDLAAKIIREGIAYADRFGFKPNRDYPTAAVLLEGADPDACHVEIPLGIEGKPTFIAGPHDNVPKVMAQLERSAGPGNYHYLIGFGDEDFGEESDLLDVEEDDFLALEDDEFSDPEVDKPAALEEAQPDAAEQPNSFWTSLLHRRRQ